MNKNENIPVGDDLIISAIETFETSQHTVDDAQKVLNVMRIDSPKDLVIFEEINRKYKLGLEGAITSKFSQRAREGAFSVRSKIKMGPEGGFMGV